MSTPVVAGVDDTSSNRRATPSSGKMRLPAAEHDRLDHEVELVDEVVRDELLARAWRSP